MNYRTIRGRSPVSGFAITGIGVRRRMLERLRPEGGFIPLDLDLLDVVAELDPGMIDWRANHVTRATGRSG
jgi:hypothetical protein